MAKLRDKDEELAALLVGKRVSIENGPARRVTGFRSQNNGQGYLPSVYLRLAGGEELAMSTLSDRDYTITKG